MIPWGFDKYLRERCDICLRRHQCLHGDWDEDTIERMLILCATSQHFKGPGDEYLLSQEERDAAERPGA